ncbi:MAG: hypothetical protein WC861_03160 [Candidatus Micrarchaeia archaeon]|jgi:hypothetical protein
MRTKQKEVKVTLPIGRIVRGLMGNKEFKALHLLSESVGNLLQASHVGYGKFENKVLYDTGKKAYTFKVVFEDGISGGSTISLPVEYLSLSAKGAPEPTVHLEYFGLNKAIKPKSYNNIKNSIIGVLADLAKTVGKRSDYESVAGRIGSITERVIFHFQH